MLKQFAFRPKARSRASVSKSELRTRRLGFQPLESRHLMAGIPALSSLPGAAHSIYLDFDGDFQSTWNRTDSNQHYTNVSVGQFNIDNTAGISDAESAAIQKIWETVADDYAPFNVNVTTVATSSFANGAAMRVVMAGDCSATLRTSPTTTINVSGDRFIATNTGTLVDTSGYSAVGSFNNAEPNVVYVFAKYMSTWGTTDSEGHTRDLRAIIATTASHEAGHSFGLVHQGNYDVGSSITTPIMGSNTQGDRTVWSTYTAGGVTHNNLTELTNVLGARADEVGGSYPTGGTFQFTNYSVLRGWNGNVGGIIGTAGDADMFRLNITSGGTYRFNLTVPQFGNLDSQLVLYRVNRLWWGGYRYDTVASADPGISSITPFSGLGASFTANLTAGTYAVAVRSHGSFGDLGRYNLNISQPIYVIIDPPIVLATSSAGATANKQTIATTQHSTVEQTKLGAGANSQELLKASQPILASLATSQAEATKKPSIRAIDDVFNDLATELPAARRTARGLG
jgi:hypothetical protein